MIYVHEALAILIANKLRSLLTVLGLIIGVGAVVAIQVLGSSMTGAIDGLLGGMSDNSFIIFPDPQQRNVEEAAIKLSDLSRIRSTVQGIVESVPLADVSDVIRHAHNAARYDISPESAIPFDNLPPIYGRRIDGADISRAADVAVLKNDAYERLFPNGGDPTGQRIYAGPNEFIVIGVLAPPRQGALKAEFGGRVAIPWTTYVDRYLHGNTLFAARFVVSNPAQIGTAEVATIAALRSIRGRPDIQYQTFDKSQITKGIGAVFRVITFVVALVGAVSLVVAGIGIMNIMLVSVTERTREIGVRKAIGARSSDVLLQFFIEALILCGTGCAIGWAIGVGIGAAVNALAIVKVSGSIPPVPWFSTILLTAIFAVVVTLAFGTYPAYRAAKLDPIEALRYE